MTGTHSHSIAFGVNWLSQAGLSGLSMTGGNAGIPVFMPREQITNFKYVKPVSDVWSIGFTKGYHLRLGGKHAHRHFPHVRFRNENLCPNTLKVKSRCHSFALR